MHRGFVNSYRDRFEGQPAICLLLQSRDLLIELVQLRGGIVLQAPFKSSQEFVVLRIQVILLWVVKLLNLVVV